MPGEAVSNDPLQVYRRELRADHPDVGMVLHQLGGVYLSAEQPERALQLLKEVLHVGTPCHKSLGPTLPRVERTESDPSPTHHPLKSSTLGLVDS
jgi:hypothetical protein